ncbi:MAG TPA: hypothetical protein VHR66_21415 [Gemmataceae bacterium]|nr:hypothetical protein [Gemmataceae bacterium]
MNDQRQNILGPIGRFFFSPTDPTTLGFIRILTGLIVLYTHAAYTPDLLEFMGPNAWWDHHSGNKQRREAPYIPIPIGWSEFTPTIRTDDVPQRRTAEIEFFRSLPLDPAQRKEQLRYLDTLIRATQFEQTADLRASEVNYQKAFRSYNEGINLVNSAARVLTDEQKARMRAALGTEPFNESLAPIHVPDFLRSFSPQQRMQVWEEVNQFSLALPKDADQQDYVLEWMANYPFQWRTKLYQFLVGDLRVDGRDMSLPADALERAEFLDFMDTWGGDTRQAEHKGTAVFSHWYHLTDSTTIYAFHFLFLGVCVLFTIGLWSRVTSVLVWTGTLCYIHRGQLILFGQDTMQTILIMYLMIGPCGAALSIDALLKRYRAAKAQLAAGGRPIAWAEQTLAGPVRSWLANLAMRLLQVNFCLIYLSSGVSKLKGTTWWEHSAAWLTLSNPEFGLMRYPAYEWLMRLLVESRLLMGIIAGSVTVFTLFVELSFPLLIWTRLRPVMVCLSVMLHFGIGIIMGLTVFGLYMFTMALGYFPSRLIRDRVCVTPGSGRKLIMRFDSRSPKALRMAARIKALDLAGQVTFVDTAGHEGGVRLTGPDGEARTGREVTRTALRELSLLRPFRLMASVF